MVSSSERHPAGFDPSQPGIRCLQQWIRQRTPLRITCCGGSQLQGVPAWVDADFLALLSADAPEPLLVNRSAIAWIQVQS
jgi:host factor-I protein